MPRDTLASECGRLGSFLGVFHSLLGSCCSRAAAECLGGEPGLRASSPHHTASSPWPHGNSKPACRHSPSTMLCRKGWSWEWAGLFRDSMVLTEEESGLPCTDRKSLLLGCTPAEEEMWGSWHQKALTYYGISTLNDGSHGQAQLYPRLIWVFRRAYNKHSFVSHLLFLPLEIHRGHGLYFYPGKKVWGG